MSLSFFILCTDGLGSNYKHFRKTAKWNWRGDRTLLSFLEGWPRAAPVWTTEMRPLRDKPEWIRSSSPSVPGGHVTSWFRCGVKLSTIFFKRHREKKNLCLWLIFLAKLIYLVHSNRHCCNHLKWYFIWQCATRLKCTLIGNGEGRGGGSLHASDRPGPRLRRRTAVTVAQLRGQITATPGLLSCSLEK